MGAWPDEVVALMVTPVYKICNIESEKVAQFLQHKITLSLL
jgi:hypothetical protein